MKPPKWIEWARNESELPHVVELYERHGIHAYFFWMRLNEMLAQHFNFWVPGCYKFSTTIFYAFFYPQIKDPRTLRKMMDYLNEQQIVLHAITGRTIYLYYPEMKERLDRYTKTLKKKAEENGKAAPNSASELAFWCMKMLPFYAKLMPELAKQCAEDKEFKSNLLDRDWP